MKTREYTVICPETVVRDGFIDLSSHSKTLVSNESTRILLVMSPEEVVDWFAYESYCVFQALVYRHAGPATKENEEYLYANRRRVLNELTYGLMPKEENDFFCALLPEMPYAARELLPGREVLYKEDGSIRDDALDDMKQAARIIASLRDVLALWKEASLGAGRWFITSDEKFSDEMWDEIRGFGDEIGVEAMLRAYYSGVPANDIVL